MAKFTITIDNILEGIAPNLYKGRQGQFAASIGIDPDLPLTDTGIKTSGVLVPSTYADFSSTGLSGYPLWIITNPKNELLYAYASDGEFISYSATFGSETVIGVPTSGVGNGAAYYNNFIYLATPTNISRYGPLSETAALTNTVWTGTTLGSQTALGDIAYPANRGVTLPNHPMHVHSDNKLYVGDFSTAAEANRGRGLIHWIRTTRGTNEGDTNDGTTRSAFVLPFGYAPTDIESWGNDLVISAIYLGGENTAGTNIAANNTLISGRAALFFWDAVNAPSLPYRMVPLVDPSVTALLNHNGTLYIFSGNMNNGMRVSVYEGGYRVKQIAFFEEGFSPPAGAVSGYGSRIAWGAFTTYPESAACVYALGYKDSNLPLALHNIINSSKGSGVAATNFMVSALSYVQHASFIIPRLVLGWKDGQPTEDFGIDRYSGSSGRSMWQSLTYNIGKEFRITKVSIPLGAAVASGHSLAISIFIDDASTETALTTINTTNYAASQRKVVQYPSVYGRNNFFLRFLWTSTVTLTVVPPIVIEGETLQDATR